jgi:hypothetical protein
MKKATAIFFLLCIICFPTPSFSQNNFQDIIKQFGDISKQLNNLSQDLLQINKTSYNQTEIYSLSSITNSITSSEDIIGHAMDLSFLYPSIKDEHKPELYQFFLFRFSSLKKQIEVEIESLQIAYAGIKSQAALNLIDRAKDQMRASLNLFDRCIKVLNINKKT